MGGDNGIISQTSGGGTPTIIFEGRCYQTITKVVDGVSQSVWESYDLRTGQIFWDITGVGSSAPTVIEYNQGTAAVEGGGADVGVTTSLVAIANNRLIKYNPYTGAATTNISIPTFAATQYYMDGYALSVKIINATAYNFRLINWTTIGTDSVFANRIQSNISFPLNTLGQFQDISAGICFVIREPNALDSTGLSPVGGFPFVNIYVDNATGIRHGMRIFAASLITGKLLFNTTIDDAPFSADEAPYSQVCNIADHGKLAVLTRRGFFDIFDEFTGKLLSKTESMDYPWDQPGFGAYAIQSAYGLLYREAYSGVYAFSWDTGKIVWKYEAPANAYETPYTDANGSAVYSWYSSGIVADGKLYTYNSEHTPTQPITRGWSLHCINATTGEGIWNITGSMSPGAVADGYLTASNSYDGYMYVFGKGKSATTVSAPTLAVTSGQSAVITGTVLDQSPGQPGTPCVSEDSMATYMEYLHMQSPIDGLYHNVTVTGVPVSIDAVDPNGNSVHIATVTSDVSGTFGYTWTPTLAGQYTITATFVGDDSYGSSWAQTYATVTQAPAATPTATPISFDVVNNSMTTMVLGGVVAIIVAIAIATVLILRKRP